MQEWLWSLFLSLNSFGYQPILWEDFCLSLICLKNNGKIKQNLRVGLSQGLSWKCSCLCFQSFAGYVLCTKHCNRCDRKYKCYVRNFNLSNKVTVGKTKLMHKKKSQDQLNTKQCVFDNNFTILVKLIELNTQSCYLI